MIIVAMGISQNIVLYNYQMNPLLPQLYASL